MHGYDGNGEPTNFCGLLAQELSKLLYRTKRPTEAKTNIHRRVLHIETLEARCLMATTTTTVDWFEEVAEASDDATTAVWTTDTSSSTVTDTITTQTGSSNVYDWIIQFDTSSLTNISSVSDTISLLSGSSITFQVLSGLGSAGLVLIESSGATYDSVVSYLAENASISSYEQDAVRAADSTSSVTTVDKTWGLDTLDVSDACSSITTSDEEVVVAVIDTGVDYTHTDLASRMWTNTGEIAGNGIDDDGNGFVDDVYGYDFANSDGDPMDDNNHGTHVAGIIDSVCDSSTVTDSSVSIMAVKFLNSDGSGNLSDAIKAINYVTMMRTDYDVNIRVINASWGSSTFSSAMNTAIQAAGNAGILFVTAAGNDSTDNDTTAEYPSSYTATNIISVAASTKSNSLASFSNYGDSTVDVAAPGVTIYSTLIGNSYGAYSGTSMATPYVSAIAALCWVVDSDASVSEVKEAIIDGCVSSSSLSGKVASSGVVNAYNTIKIILASTEDGPSVSSLAASASTVTAGNSITLTATGISASSGSITSVSFYQDVNGNGTYDSGDVLVGSCDSVTNGEASVTFSTSGYAAGVYQFIALVTDSNSNTATSSSVSVTVQKNSAPVIASISAQTMSSTQTSMAIPLTVTDSESDKLTYTVTITTTSGSAISSDNVSGTISDNTLTITRNSSYTSSFLVTITVSDGANVSTASFTVSIQNTSPALSSIDDQTMSSTQKKLKLTLSATDSDGDKLTYSVKILKYDSLSVKAYNLDQKYSFSKAGSAYTTNLHGAGEKYLVGKNNIVYFILPNGKLYRWRGSIAKSTLVATLSSTYYSTLSLLYNAKSPALIKMTSPKITASIAGNELIINRSLSYTSDFYVQVTVSDGNSTSTQTFHVTISSTGSISAKSVEDESDTSETFLESSGSEFFSTIPPLALAAAGNQASDALASSGLNSNSWFEGVSSLLTATTSTSVSSETMSAATNVGLSLLGGLPETQSDAMTAIDNALALMENHRSSHENSEFSENWTNDEDRDQSCIDALNALQLELHAILNRHHSVAIDAVDQYFTEDAD